MFVSDVDSSAAVYGQGPGQTHVSHSGVFTTTKEGGGRYLDEVQKCPGFLTPSLLLQYYSAIMQLLSIIICFWAPLSSESGRHTRTALQKAWAAAVSTDG